MSFIYASLDNQTPYLHTESDYDSDLILDGYLKYKYSVGNTSDDKISMYKKKKNTVIDDILQYNYQRFTNGQLTLAILSLIMYNYNFMTN